MKARIVDEETIDQKIAAAIANGGGGGSSYLVYAALIVQDAQAHAPTVLRELENTTGGNVTWSYDGVGQYEANSSNNAFTVGKTICPPFGGINNGAYMSGSNGGFYQMSCFDVPSSVGLFSFDNTFTPQQLGTVVGGINTPVYVEIRVYP